MRDKAIDIRKVWRSGLMLLAVLMMGVTLAAPAAAKPGQPRTWVATWGVALAGPTGDSGERDPLPHGRARDQTIRMIVRPDIWSDTVRVRFSNAFGDKPLAIGAATIALQEDSGNLLRGTLVQLRFGGAKGTVIPPGGRITSDPVRIGFVNARSRPWLDGRALAVSFAVQGESGQLSVNGSQISAWLSPPGSGDRTADTEDTSFPHAMQMAVVVDMVDALAAPDAIVICALGESVTGGGGTTNSYDLWPNVLARRLRERLGRDRVSVVNMGIGGNTVAMRLPGHFDPVPDRLDRDVLAVTGLTHVVWMQGINDLVWGKASPDVLIAGYRGVIDRLHARGIKVMGGTITSNVWPYQRYQESPLGPDLAKSHGNPDVDARRRQVNAAMRAPGLFDAVADMAGAIEDPETGAMRRETQGGDYIHPNRAGHHAMAGAIDLDFFGKAKGR